MKNNLGRGIIKLRVGTPINITKNHTTFEDFTRKNKLICLVTF